MAQYKVPQDVEADDKLIGPFGFRQFIYLLIAAGFLALAWLLGSIFIFLAIIPLPFAFFLLVLALPLRKDQPMETYIAALINFYRKPKKRYFNPGQRESTIEITAPKVVEKSRTRNITSDDASRRLSFLASVVDSEGLSIKDGVGPVRDEFIAEANATPDMFDIYQTQRLQTTLAETDADRHAEALAKMRAALKASETNFLNYAPAQENSTPEPSALAPTPENPAATAAPNLSPASPTVATNVAPPAPDPLSSSAVVRPDEVKPETLNHPKKKAKKKPSELKTSAGMIELAHTDDLSVATIAKEANKRASRKADDKEVYISLH